MKIIVELFVSNEIRFIFVSIFFNSKDLNIPELEAQLSGFDISVESLHDDLMDTLAYHTHFTKNRSFERDDDDEEEFEYGSTW